MMTTLLAGCASSADDEEASTDGVSAAIEEQWRVATPTILSIERPLDLTLRDEDFSSFEVRDPLRREYTWKPARAESAFVFDKPSVGSKIQDQLKNGFGSGPCRPRINFGRKEIGFRCTWKF